MNILIKYFSKLSNLGIRSDMTYFDKFLFRSINKGKITNQGYGIGLDIYFSFIKVLKGSLKYKARDERGLEVTIQLPNQSIEVKTEVLS